MHALWTPPGRGSRRRKQRQTSGNRRFTKQQQRSVIAGLGKEAALTAHEAGAKIGARLQCPYCVQRRCNSRNAPLLADVPYLDGAVYEEWVVDNKHRANKTLKINRTMGADGGWKHMKLHNSRWQQ